MWSKAKQHNVKLGFCIWAKVHGRWSVLWLTQLTSRKLHVSRCQANYDRLGNVWQPIDPYQPYHPQPLWIFVSSGFKRFECRMAQCCALVSSLGPRTAAQHLATSGDRPWPFPLFMILRMRRCIQEVPLLLNTKVAMDNTWQYFKAHSIFLERSCTYLQDFARKHLNALVTDPCSLRHHPQHTASWCWCLPGIRSARAHQAKSSNLAGENVLPTGGSHFLPKVCLSSFVLLRFVLSCYFLYHLCWAIVSGYIYWLYLLGYCVFDAVSHGSCCLRFTNQDGVVAKIMSSLVWSCLP